MAELPSQHGYASAQTSAAALDPRRRSLAFATLTIAFVMDVLDGTIVNVALPAIRADLSANETAVQWMVAGYSTAFAMLLISGGRMGDIYGYRRMFMTGIAGFTLSSLLCGLARTPEELVLARMAQGATAACMGPQVLALIQLFYAPYERIRIFSFFGLLGGLSAVLGPIVGGVLIDFDPLGLGWRLIFLINLPIGIIGMVAASRLLPVGRSEYALRMDWIGNALVIVGLFALIIPTVQGRALGWPAWCIILLVASVPIGWFSWRHMREQVARGGSPLIEPVLFAEPRFPNGLLLSVIFSTVSGGFLLVLTLTLQLGLGMDPLAAGLIHVPFAIGVGVGVSVLGRRLLPRYGRSVLMIGAGIMAGGIAALIPLVARDAPTAVLGTALLLAGLGMGMVAGPLSPITLAEVDARHAGGASGLLKSVQQLGTALGAALLGMLFFAWAGDATDTSVIRFAFAQASLVMILLLVIVILLARRLPTVLFLYKSKEVVV